MSETAHLLKLAKNVPDVFLVIDDNFICRYASPSMIDVLGWSPEEVIGHPRSEFVMDDKTAPSFYVTELGIEYYKAIPRVKCKDGSLRWMEFWGRKVDGLLYAAGRPVKIRCKPLDHIFERRDSIIFCRDCGVWAEMPEQRQPALILPFRRLLSHYLLASSALLGLLDLVVIV